MLNRPQWRTSIPTHGTDHDGNAVPVVAMIIEWRTRFGIALLVGDNGAPIVLSPKDAVTLSWSLTEAATADVRGQLVSTDRPVSITITPLEGGELRLATSDGGFAVLAPEARRALANRMRQTIVERDILENRGSVR